MTLASSINWPHLHQFFSSFPSACTTWRASHFSSIFCSPNSLANIVAPWCRRGSCNCRIIDVLSRSYKRRQYILPPNHINAYLHFILVHSCISIDFHKTHGRCCLLRIQNMTPFPSFMRPCISIF
jgi:hypothetical protein